MTSQELQDRLLEELSRGPAGAYILAGELHEPPFRVLAELSALKRARLVTEHFSTDARLFSLTGSGIARLGGINQLKVF